MADESRTESIRRENASWSQRGRRLMTSRSLEVRLYCRMGKIRSCKENRREVEP